MGKGGNVYLAVLNVCGEPAIQSMRERGRIDEDDGIGETTPSPWLLPIKICFSVDQKRRLSKFLRTSSSQ